MFIQLLAPLQNTYLCITLCVVSHLTCWLMKNDLASMHIRQGVQASKNCSPCTLTIKSSTYWHISCKKRKRSFQIKLKNSNTNCLQKGGTKRLKLFPGCTVKIMYNLIIKNRLVKTLFTHKFQASPISIIKFTYLTLSYIVWEILNLGKTIS